MPPTSTVSLPSSGSGDYVAEQVGPNTIEVSPLSSVRHDHVRVELDLFLKAWHVAHPDAHAEFVE